MQFPFQYVYFPVYALPALFNGENNIIEADNANSEGVLSTINVENEQQFLEQFKKELQSRKPTFNKKVWKEEEDQILMEFYENGSNWEEISQHIPKTNPEICKRRFLKLKEKNSKWSKKDDSLIKHLREKQEKSWEDIANCFEERTAKQIRERYENYLRAGIKTDEWLIEEDLEIIKQMRVIGKKWKQISEKMVFRTQIQVKNRYYGTLKALQKKVREKLQSQS